MPRAHKQVMLTGRLVMVLLFWMCDRLLHKLESEEEEELWSTERIIEQPAALWA